MECQGDARDKNVDWTTDLALTPFAFSQVAPKIVVFPRFHTDDFEVILDIIGEFNRVHE